jgi:hypothetical protein
MAARLKKLESENAQMKAYILKSGLSWPPPIEQPSSSSSSSNAAPAAANTADSVSSDDIAEINSSHLPRLLKNIDELNDMAPERDLRNGGFADAAEVMVVFYANGISVNRGPLRPYAWPLAQQFLKDLFDGYFPYEFKDAYPDGVRIRAVDKSSERFVQGQADPERHVLSQEQFLRKLPKTVIKNGKVIEIHNPQARKEQKMQQQQQQPVEVKRVATLDELLASVDEKEVATVNVRGPEGTVVQRIRIPKLATLALLKSHISCPGVTTAFKLRTAFPPREFTDEDSALVSVDAAGLFPNGVVIVVPSKP